MDWIQCSHRKNILGKPENGSQSSIDPPFSSFSVIILDFPTQIVVIIRRLDSFGRRHHGPHRRPWLLPTRCPPLFGGKQGARVLRSRKKKIRRKNEGNETKNKRDSPSTFFLYFFLKNFNFFLRISPSKIISIYKIYLFWIDSEIYFLPMNLIGLDEKF